MRSERAPRPHCLTTSQIDNGLKVCLQRPVGNDGADELSPIVGDSLHSAVVVLRAATGTGRVDLLRIHLIEAERSIATHS